MSATNAEPNLVVDAGGNGYAVTDPNWRKRPKVWTPPRLWRLMEMLENGYSDDQIAARLGTTVNAVQLARKRHGIRPRRELLLSARRVADLLGVSCAKTITRWIEQGHLRGRRGQQYGPNRQWYVKWSDLQAFIESPDTWHLWQPERITHPDLRSLARRVRSTDRYLTPREVADRLYVTHGAVNDWIHRGLLPAVRNGNWLVRESDLVGFIPPSQRRRVGQRGQPWTDDELRTLAAMRQAGATWREIADTLDRSIQSVSNRWHRRDRRLAAAVAPDPI